MSWGYKILSVYLVFVAGIIYLVVQSSMQKVDLVTPEYYEKELLYQERIDDEARTSALSSRLKVEEKDHQITVHFPEEMKGRTVNAELLLYCPADKTKDLKLNVSTIEGKVFMDVPTNYQGRFEMQVSWKNDGKGYYATEKLFIQ